MPSDELSPPAPRPLVQFRMALVNSLPEALHNLAEKHGDADRVEWAEEQVHQAELEQLYLARKMELPGIPQVGDEVRVLDGRDLLRVIGVEWILDPSEDEAQVLVFLDDLDADEFGLMTTAAAVLLERGWVPLLDD
jgi:hypothetical protein